MSTTDYSGQESSGTDTETDTSKTELRAQWEAFEFRVPASGAVRIENVSYGEESGDHVYVVTVESGAATECTCPADEYQPGACKHRHAVESQPSVLDAASAHEDDEGSYDPIVDAQPPASSGQEAVALTDGGVDLATLVGRVRSEMIEYDLPLAIAIEEQLAHTETTVTEAELRAEYARRYGRSDGGQFIEAPDDGEILSDDTDDEQPVFSYHIESPEQGGEDYARCTDCGREILTRYGVDTLGHADGCANGDESQ